MKLEFKHVTKRYSEVAAVREVNYVMEQGIYGLLGVNGAGKTTLMRMLCTIIQPSEGEILWNGKEIWKLGSAYREVLGYLPQEFGYYPDLNVYDYMMYISSIKGLKQAFANRRIKQLLEQVDMWKFRKRKMKHLSGGMVRRVGIAQAMLNDPKILVLDEPTAGLDPSGRDEILDLVAKLHKERNLTVILVSHSMEDVARYVERLIVMNHGTVAFDATPGEVFSHYKELEKIGLMAPQVTYVMEGLARRGVTLPHNAITVQEAVDSILQAR